MRKRIIALFLLAFSFGMGGCLKDDLENLQNQVDELNKKVDDLEKTQEQALLDAIASLQAAINSLETSSNEQYAALLANLTALQNEVVNNAATVYFGNVLTDADYDSLTKKGSTIITGKVQVKSNSQLSKLSSIKMIGGSLTIGGITNGGLSNLESVGSDLIITGINSAANMNLAKLASVGGRVVISANSGLTAVTANKLVFVNSDLTTNRNDNLTDLSFSNLDFVGEIDIDEYYEADPNYLFFGKLSTINLSATDVLNDVNISYIGNGGNLNLGKIGGSFQCMNTGLSSISVASTTIPGDFIFEYNGLIETVNLDQIQRIDGNISISFNDNTYDWSAPSLMGLSQLPTFAGLTTIGGNVNVTSNRALSSIEGFNNVVSFKGTSINFENNGTSLELINVFDALVTAGPNSYSTISINIFEYTNWFDSFNALQKGNNISVTIYKPMEAGGGIGIGANAVTDVAKVSGFDAMTEVSTLLLGLNEATEFDAFPALSNFKNFGNYLSVYMPMDTEVGLCSVEPILTKVKNGDFDTFPSRIANFYFNYSTMDRNQAIDQLLAPCN